MVRRTRAPFLTGKFEPLGHLSWVTPAGFSSLGRWILLALHGPAGVRTQQLRRIPQLTGGHGAGGGRRGREYAAKRDYRKKMIKNALGRMLLHLSFHQSFSAEFTLQALMPNSKMLLLTDLC